MDTIWNWDGRYVIAAFAAAYGATLLAHAVLESARGWRMSIETPGKNLRWIRGFRGAIQGACIVTAAAGWAFHLPVLIAIAAAIVIEETIECSIVAWALNQELEAESQSPPPAALTTTRSPAANPHQVAR